MIKSQLLALQAEFIKIKSSSILWGTFIAFGLAPVMGAVFMIILNNPDAMAKAGALALKAEAMNFGADWKAYFDILTQAVGVGGIMVFGFVASWLFGREYSDRTAKDLLALPTSRATILNAKFIIYILWCFALVLSNLLIALGFGLLLQLPAMDNLQLSQAFYSYCITTILTIIIGTPIAFFALWGKGYLAPLGFVALTLVFAQVIAATGYGSYFPWSIPGLYSGAGGEYKDLLNSYSYLILSLTGVVGYVVTIVYWKFADQTQ